MGKTLRWLKARDAADRACCETRTIRRAVRNGLLRAVRVGHHGELRFLEEWIDQWLIDQLMPEDHGIDIAIDAGPSGPRERDRSQRWEVQHDHSF